MGSLHLSDPGWWQSHTTPPPPYLSTLSDLQASLHNDQEGSEQKEDLTLV
jgi:hypothetical protein